MGGGRERGGGKGRQVCVEEGIGKVEDGRGVDRWTGAVRSLTIVRDEARSIKPGKYWDIFSKGIYLVKEHSSVLVCGKCAVT